ncbi:hypothetical protein BX666DRAFT_1858904 [Dichotomocladium elegans]|nr:hypothetical protein BX666DRAFT_1858904 [Dichotomocladium elegans]
MIIPEVNGSYTPPAPDRTLLEALDKVSAYDYNRYCESWNPEHGFPDDDGSTKNSGTCGTWQADYIALHRRRLYEYDRIKELTNDTSPPTFVSYVCHEDPRHRVSKSCGGLADRMNGMVSTFFYALLTDRAYLAHWDRHNPMLLEDLFEKPTINWSFDPEKMRRAFENGKGDRRLSYRRVNTLNYNWAKVGERIFPQGVNQDFRALWNESYIEWHNNRAFVIRTLEHSARYIDQLAPVGLNKDNAFRCIIDFLFRPKPGPRQFIHAYKAMFQMDSVLSIGLQIRTGDSGIVNPDRDISSLADWSYFLTCANQLREAKRTQIHTEIIYFLVTDSAHLRDEFVALNHDKTKAAAFLGPGYEDVTMVVTGLPIEHIEAKTVRPKFAPNKTLEPEPQDDITAGVHAAVIENWLLSYTDYRLISRQGFGKLAAFHAQDAHTTIGMPKVSCRRKEERERERTRGKQPDLMRRYSIPQREIYRPTAKIRVHSSHLIL